MHPGKDWIDSNYHPGTHFECIQQRTALTFNYHPQYVMHPAKDWTWLHYLPVSGCTTQQRWQQRMVEDTQRVCCSAHQSVGHSSAIAGRQGCRRGGLPCRIRRIHHVSSCTIENTRKQLFLKNNQTQKQLFLQNHQNTCVPINVYQTEQKHTWDHSGICIAINVQARAGETSVPGGYPHLE